jgi:hypothetical protein
MPDKWYLNKPPGAAPANTGTDIKLEAKRKTFHKPGATFRRVSWTLVKDLGGLDPSAYPTGVGVFEHEITQEEQDRRFRNKLKAGEVTKVTYKVTAAKSGQAANNVAFDKTYETWRKIYLDVVYVPGTKVHYDAIKPRFTAAFAAVGYEFVENSVTAALVDEAKTDCAQPLLPHLYANPTADLPHKPFHLRMVICKDIVEAKDEAATWRMDRTTLRGTGVTQVWSTGTTLHYASTVQLMNGNPTDCVVRAIESVAVPGAAITRHDAKTVRIDLSHVALAGARDALAAGRKVSLKAKLNATTAKPTTLKLSLDHKSKDAPIQIGTTRVTVAQNLATWVVTIHDDAHTWAAAPVKSAALEGRSQEKFASQGWATAGKQSVVADIVRHSDHELRLTVPNVHESHAILGAAGPTEYGVGRDRRIRGLALELALWWDAVAAEEEVDAEVKAAATGAYRYVAAGPRIEVVDDARTFDAISPLVGATLLVAGADVVVPGEAITTSTDDKQVSFDLTHVDLAAPRAVFEGGGTLEVKATMHAITSFGGYSPERDRHFVALTTVKMRPTQTAADIQNLLLGAALHELGHAHGLVESLPKYGGGETRSNGKYYEDEFGGQGPHCSTNAKLAPSGPSYGRKSTSSGQVFIHDGGGGKLCIMYHDLDIPNSSMKFCDACAEHLRLRALHKLVHTNA